MLTASLEDQDAAREALRFDASLAQGVIQNLRDVVFQTSADGCWTYLNRAWTELSGFSVSQTLGKRLASYVHPEDISHVEITRESSVEVRLLTACGDYRWVKISNYVAVGESGKVEGWSGTINAVAEHQVVVDTSIARLESLLKNIPGAIYSGPATPECPITYCTSNIEDVLGYSAEEFTSGALNWQTLIHKDDLPSVQASQQELLQTGAVSYQSRAWHKNGELRWLQCQKRLGPEIGTGQRQYQAYLSDISTLKDTTQALERRGLILKAVGYVAKRFLHAQDWEAEIPSALEQLGLASGAVRVSLFEGGNLELGYGPLRGEWVSDELAEAGFSDPVPITAGREPWGWIVFEYYRSDAATGPAPLLASLRAAADMIGAAIQRQRAERALVHREALLQSMAKATPLGFYVVDTQTDEILYVNDRFCQIWNFTELADSIARGELKYNDLLHLRLDLVADPESFRRLCLPLDAPGILEDEILFVDGRTIRRITTPIEDGRGSSRLYVFEDITERKRNDLELKATKQRLEFLLSSSPAVIFTTDARTRATTWISQNVQSLLGFGQEEFLDNPTFWSTLVHPSDRVLFEHRTSDSESLDATRVQARYRHKTGGWRWVRSDVKRVGSGLGGSVEELIGSLSDVTDAVTALRAVQRREAVLEAVSSAATRFLHATNWEHESSAMLERLGRATEARRATLIQAVEDSGELQQVLAGEWVAPGHQDGVTPSGMDLALCMVRDGSNDGCVRAHSNQGDALIAVPVFVGDACWGFLGLEDANDREWTTATIEAMRTAAGILGGAIQRTKAERALREAHSVLEERVRARTVELAKANISLQESVQLYRTLIETSPDAILFSDLNHSILMANQQALALLGITEPHNPVGLTVCDFIVPDSREQARALLASVVEIGVIKDLEFEFQRLDGSLFSGEVGAASIQGADQQPRYILSVIRDVTPRKQAAEAVQRSERRFRAVFDEAPIGIALLDRQARIVDANHFFRRMFGYSADELRGASYASIVRLTNKQHRNGSAHPLGSLGDSVQRSESTCSVKSGSEIWVRTTIAKLESPGEDVFAVAMIEDITSRKQLEEQFRQAQKMEAIGRLAGGVAHDFNNLLTVIKGYSELLVKKLPEQDSSGKKIRQISKAADRASALVQQLLAFSRKQDLEPKVLQINQALTDLEKMLRRLIGENIELTTELDGKAGCILIDPGQFDQMIMNLVVNARDAMPSGGRIKLSTRRVDSVGELPFRPSRRTEQYLMLSVTDNGVGMTEEIKSKVFEPFFTTKEVGKGTGLGLSTVYGIVQQSSGHITVDSSPGVGTLFSIYLPWVSSNPSDANSHLSLEPAETREVILLVEDEDLVRAMVSEALQDAGYTVIEARNGIDAIRASEQWNSDIDLILTDLMMPQMGGDELWRTLAPSRPRTKVLFMSGHTDREIPKGMFLHKPFAPDSLILKVREVLG